MVSSFFKEIKMKSIVVLAALAIAGCATSNAVTQSEVERFFEDSDTLFALEGGRLTFDAPSDMPTSGK